MAVADLPQQHAPAWARATRHPFLAAVRDGTLPEAAFRSWLAQDYCFVADLLVFQSGLLARAPRHAQRPLAAGTVALVDELTWFEQQARGLELDLRTDPLPATVAYRVLLEHLAEQDFPVALAALWAIERAYLDAWSFAAPGAEPYRECVAHWTVPEFADYVATLESAADQAAGGLASGTDVDDAFLAVAAAEADFWQSTWRQDDPL